MASRDTSKEVQVAQHEHAVNTVRIQGVKAGVKNTHSIRVCCARFGGCEDHTQHQPLVFGCVVSVLKGALEARTRGDDGMMIPG